MITSPIVTIFGFTSIFAYNNFISTLIITDLPEMYVKHGVVCGALHHPGDIEEYPMFKKNDAVEDEMDNDPVLVNEFWVEFIPLKVTTVCKHAAVTDEDHNTTNIKRAMYPHNMLGWGTSIKLCKK